MLKFLRKELVALIAEAGAALTVLGQIASEIRLPDWLSDFLIFWRTLLASLWQPVLVQLNWALHPHLIAALSLSVFLVMLGLGGRIARSTTRRPLAPIEMRFLDDMSLMSLFVYACLVYAFLIGSGPDPAKGPPIELFGSELAGRYTFALIVTIGYGLGDFLGHKAFHRRLLRVAIVVIAVIIGLAFIMQVPGTALPAAN